MRSHQARLMLFSCRVLSAVIISFCLTMPSLAYDGQGEGRMTTDDMLVYTIKDLYTRMQGIIEENSRLKRKSESIRKRILLLRKEMRALEDDRFKKLEETVQLTDLIKLDERDSDTTKDRRANLEKYKQQLLRENTKMEGDAAKSAAETESLDQYIIKLQDGLTKLEEKKVGTGFRAVKERYDQEKQELQVAINGSNDRLQRIQKEIDLLSRDIAKFEKEKKAAVTERRSLKEDLQDVKSALLLDLGERKSLEGAQKRQEEQARKMERDIKEEIEQLQVYQENLELSVKKLLNANDVATQKSDVFDRTIEDAERMYALERDLLLEKESVLKQYADHVVNVQEGKESRLAYETSQEDLSGKKNDLVEEQELLGSQIEKEEELSLSLAEERQVVSAEVEEAADEIRKKLKYKPSGKGESSQRRALKLQIGETKDSIRDIERKTKKLMNSNRKAQAEFAKLEKVQAKLQMSEENYQDAWQALAPDQDVTDSDVIAQQSAEGQVDRLKEEIDALKLRSSILSSSMQTVESKYKADKQLIREFKMEKEQLMEYLSMLINENKGLEAKIESLQEGLGVTRAP